VGFDNGEVILLDAIGMTQLAKFNSGGTLNAGTLSQKYFDIRSLLTLIRSLLTLGARSTQAHSLKSTLRSDLVAYVCPLSKLWREGERSLLTIK
jgi:hypothetical protein